MVAKRKRTLSKAELATQGRRIRSLQKKNAELKKKKA